MVLVGSSSFLSRKDKGADGADLQILQQGMVVQALADVRLSCVRRALIAANSTPELFQYKMSPTLSFSGMYKNHLFIVGIEPIINKELEFIFRSDCSDRMYVYS